MTAALAALLLIPAIAAASDASANLDLVESYRLLTTTYFTPVDSQRLLDGARSALREIARAQGVTLNLPAVQSADAASDLAQLRDEIGRAQKATHVSTTRLTYAAIDGMAKAVGDKYTTFFTPEELRRFNQSLDPGKISGIGVLIQPDDPSKYIRAYYVVPGTPADNAGIQSGDIFTAVDGVSTRGFTVDQATKVLRGEPGTPVRVTVQRNGAPFTVSVIRAAVQPPTVIYKMLPQKVGYIYVLAFGRETPDQFGTALDRLERSGARGYVMDLRNDGGGYVESAIDISCKFVGYQPLFTLRARGAPEQTIPGPCSSSINKPVTILVNRYTASASEITAGALQDDGVAVLVGEKTFGKGVMQTLNPLPDGAAIKITTAHYLTPKYRDINLKGIEPDYAVSENKDARFGEVDHDAQLQAALAILSKKVAKATP